MEDPLMGELISIRVRSASLPPRVGEDDGTIIGDDEGTGFSFCSRLDARGVACDPAAVD